MYIYINITANKITVVIGIIMINNCFIENSIIGWNSHIGKWCRVQDYSVLGEDVTVRDEFLLKNNIVLPNVTIKSNPKEGEILLA